MIRVFRKVLCCVATVVITGTIGVALAQIVTAVDGNICYTPRSNTDRKQLTTTGLDNQPKLSPNGSVVVFVRENPGRRVQTGYPDIDATEFWTIRVDGSDARLRVRGKAAKTVEA